MVSEDRAEYTVAQLEAAGYTKADLRLPAKGRRGAKFGNQKELCINGHQHDSGVEKSRCDALCAMQRAGKIAGLVIHPEFELQPKFKRDGKTERAIKYIGDFFYCQGSLGICEDVKGGKVTRTAVFEIKRKMLLYQRPDITFRIVGM